MIDSKDTRATIVVLGMHRSGTSVVSSLVRDLGVNVGDNLLGAGDGNELGHFEDEDVRSLNNYILKLSKGNWHNPPSRYQIMYIARQKKLASIRKLIDEKNTRNVWAFKDPRSALTLPLYLNKLRSPYFIICKRSYNDIANSLLSRDGDKYGSREKLIELSREYYQRIYSEIALIKNPNCIEVNYDELLREPAKTTEKIAKFLPIHTDREAIKNAASNVIAGKSRQKTTGKNKEISSLELNEQLSKDKKYVARPLKILVFSHTSDMVGGAERSIIELMDKWVHDFNVEPQFILPLPTGKLVAEMKIRGWKYYGIRYYQWMSKRKKQPPMSIFKEAKINTSAVFEIEKIIKESKPDIVLTNSLVCPWGALAAHFRNVPHVWFVREYGDLDHGLNFDISRDNTFKDVGNLSELVLVNSLTLKNHVQQYIPEEKVKVLYHPFNIKNILNLSKQPSKKIFRYADSIKLVLVAGGITESKGQLEVLKALAGLTSRGISAEVCLVGEETNRKFKSELDEFITIHNIADRVHFTGWLGNPLTVVNQADIGITASKQEAFGRLTFEYMVLSKPVIGTRSGATPEMVKDDINGYLYDRGDVVQLQNAIEKYTEDKQLIKQHGIESQKKSERMMSGQHNSDEIFERINQVYLNGKTTGKPIKYLHTWAEIPRSIQKYIDYTDSVPLTKLLKKRSELLAKKVYIKIKNIKDGDGKI